MLGERQQRCVPTVGVQPRRRVDRQPEIVADFRTRDALGLILVKAWRPLAGEIDSVRLRRRSLCERWSTDDRRQQQRRARGEHHSTNSSHMSLLDRFRRLTVFVPGSPTCPGARPRTRRSLYSAASSSAWPLPFLDGYAHSVYAHAAARRLANGERLLGIKRHADLQQSRIRDRRRRQPGPERLVHGQDRAAVQGVVEVEIDGRSGS